MNKFSSRKSISLVAVSAVLFAVVFSSLLFLYNQKTKKVSPTVVSTVEQFPVKQVERSPGLFPFACIVTRIIVEEFVMSDSQVIQGGVVCNFSNFSKQPSEVFLPLVFFDSAQSESIFLNKGFVYKDKFGELAVKNSLEKLGIGTELNVSFVNKEEGLKASQHGEYMKKYILKNNYVGTTDFIQKGETSGLEEILGYPTLFVLDVHKI